MTIQIALKSSKMIGFQKFLFWTLATIEGYHLMQKTPSILHLRRLKIVRCVILGPIFMYFFLEKSLKKRSKVEFCRKFGINTISKFRSISQN